MTARLRLLSVFTLLLSWCGASSGRAQTIYEAESSSVFLSGGASIGNYWPNASGGAFAEYITQQGTAAAPGSAVTFTFQAR